MSKEDLVKLYDAYELEIKQLQKFFNERPTSASYDVSNSARHQALQVEQNEVFQAIVHIEQLSLRDGSNE